MSCILSSVCRQTWSSVHRWRSFLSIPLKREYRELNKTEKNLWRIRNEINRNEFWITVDWCVSCVRRIVFFVFRILFETQKKFGVSMDANEFRAFGRAAVDFVADYLENIEERWVPAIIRCFPSIPIISPYRKIELNTSGKSMLGSN